MLLTGGVSFMENEKLELLLSVLGTDNKEVSKALSMAEKINTFMSKENIQTEIKTVPSDTKEDRSFKIINAALPYIDTAYRKNVFVAVKCLELFRTGKKNELFIQSDTKDTYEKRHSMLSAVIPYLNTDEKKKIKTVKKLMELNSILEG